MRRFDSDPRLQVPLQEQINDHRGLFVTQFCPPSIDTQSAHEPVVIRLRDGHADGSAVERGYFVRFSFHGLLSTGVPRNLSVAWSSLTTDNSNPVCPAPLNARALSRNWAS